MTSKFIGFANDVDHAVHLKGVLRQMEVYAEDEVKFLDIGSMVHDNDGPHHHVGLLTVYTTTYYTKRSTVLVQDVMILLQFVPLMGNKG